MTRTNLESWRLLVLIAAAMTMSMEAKPPIARQIVGQLESINPRTQQLVVTNDHRRITVHWKKSQPCNVVCASPGSDVKLYYRKESGRLVTRNIAVTGGGRCCATSAK